MVISAAAASIIVSCDDAHQPECASRAAVCANAHLMMVTMTMAMTMVMLVVMMMMVMMVMVMMIAFAPCSQSR